jgi:hypothetical protein
VTARAGSQPGDPGPARDDHQATHGSHEILARLLELTPPPPPGAPVDELLAAFEAIVAERAAVIATVALPIRVTDADRAMLVELDHRQAAWQDALTAALRAVGDQRCGANQLRAYAGAV